MSCTMATGPKKPNRRSPSGQVTLLMVLFLTVVLALSAGLAVDGAGLWFHRQAAQSAADAACLAGAVDLQYLAVNSTFPTANPLPTCSGCTTFSPTAFTCTSTSNYVPCKYAAFNGYNSAGLTSSTPNLVSVSYPVNPGGVTAQQAMQVIVTENVKLNLLPLITGSATQTIKASAICGIASVQVPVGLLVLDPTNGQATGTQKGAFQMGGTKDSINIIGGPKMSIQVNSTYSAAPYAVTVNGSPPPNVDLSNAFLNNATCPGGTFGVSAQEPNPFGTAFLGTWLANDSPVPDPFAKVPSPKVGGTVAIPPAAPAPVAYSYGWWCDNGVAATTNLCPTNTFILCPDNKNGCTRYFPGTYPTGITVKGSTAIFDPGLYYITTGGMNFDSGSFARPSGASHDYFGTAYPALWTTGSNNAYVGGTTFFFEGTGSVSFAANTGAGSCGPGSNLDCFNITSSVPTSCPSSGGTFPSCIYGKGPLNVPTTTPPTTNWPSALGVQITCDGSTPPSCPAPAPSIPSSFNSDVILGPCGSTNPFQVDASNQGRGVTFFDAHDKVNDVGPLKNNPSWSGGGNMLVVGAMYFHQCTASPCKAPSSTGDYNDTFQFGGNSGSTTFLFGDVVTDQLQMQGSPVIDMFLNSNFYTQAPKVFLIR
jgi:putative Flp pilus-assembly TadE/G-like protein